MISQSAQYTSQPQCESPLLEKINSLESSITALAISVDQMEDRLRFVCIGVGEGSMGESKPELRPVASPAEYQICDATAKIYTLNSRICKIMELLRT